MKRILSMFLALLLAFSVAMPVSAESSNTDKYTEAGNILKNLGVLKGFPDGSLGLDGELLREQLVVMISRLYGEEEKAKNFEGSNTFTDLKPEHKFYVPYIKWAVDKGLINGYPNKTFRPKNNTSVQEYQKVLLTALGYKLGPEDWNMVPALSESYGLMKDLKLNPSASLTRGQMAVMSLNTLDQEMNGKDITLADHLNIDLPKSLKIKSSHRVENNTFIVEGEITGAKDKKISLNLTSSSLGVFTPYPIDIDESGKFTKEIKDLKMGDYQYRFQSDTQTTGYKSFTIAVLPFALAEKISPANLKEIPLTFTQPVNKTVASSTSNYITTAGTIKDIRFEDNDKKVVLTLNGAMSQQTKYTISAMRIRSLAGEEVVIDKHEFETLDTEPPKMTSLEQLGNKGLRIHFSEPIKSAQASNFKIDGLNFSGSVKLENNVATLLYISSFYALKEGTHSLIISDVEDYAGYKNMVYNHEFNIIKDTSAPKIVSSSATLERVILEFDKYIDPASALTTNFFWKSGNSKRTANKVTIDGKKAIVDFTTNILSASENTIYVENAKDYFGNKISDTTKVVPVIDTTSPEVIGHSVSKDGTSISVYYSKNVTGNNRKDYTILDQNNKAVSIKDIQGSGAEYTINLYSQLPVGYNSFTVSGVKDTTTLKNPLIEYKVMIDMQDIERPRVTSSYGYGNNILIHFSKLMNMSTVTDPSNYIMIFKGKQVNFPFNTLFMPGEDGQSVTIVLPETYEGEKISIGSLNNLTEVNILRLKDKVGNDTDPLILNVKFDATSSGNAKAVDYYSYRPGRQGILEESNLIKVKFNIPIVQASKDDFTISGRRINSAIADGSNQVSIYLENTDSTSLPAGSLIILPENNMKTSIDTGVNTSTVLIWDEVAPKIKENTLNLTAYENKIELPFTETLGEEGASLYRRDLEVIRLADRKTLSESEFTTSLMDTDKSILIITLNNREISSEYSVRLRVQSPQEELLYIRDIDGNPALPSDVYFTSKAIR